MAQDVARHIYRISKEDRSLYTDEIKKLYKKRIHDSKGDIFRNLYALVTKYICDNLQPMLSELQLPKNFPGAISGVQEINIELVTEENKRYICKPPGHDFGKRWLVTNDMTCYLIDNAIIPLDLKWTLNHHGYIVVSWDHWPQNNSFTE